jgi:hypothetical protein
MAHAARSPTRGDATRHLDFRDAARRLRKRILHSRRAVPRFIAWILSSDAIKAMSTPSTVDRIVRLTGTG